MFFSIFNQLRYANQVDAGKTLLEWDFDCFNRELSSSHNVQIAEKIVNGTEYKQRGFESQCKVSHNVNGILEYLTYLFLHPSVTFSSRERVKLKKSIYSIRKNQNSR